MKQESVHACASLLGLVIANISQSYSSIDVYMYISIMWEVEINYNNIKVHGRVFNTEMPIYI